MWYFIHSLILKLVANFVICIFTVPRTSSDHDMRWHHESWVCLSQSSTWLGTVAESPGMHWQLHPPPFNTRFTQAKSSDPIPFPYGRCPASRRERASPGRTVMRARTDSQRTRSVWSCSAALSRSVRCNRSEMRQGCFHSIQFFPAINIDFDPEEDDLFDP
jgi:hypothetical protein